MPDNATPITNRPHYYVLDGKRAVPCSMEEWASRDEARTAEHDSFRVGDTQVGAARVSTVFLGLDHAFTGPPMLFETMVFEGGTTALGNWCERCTTWEQAEEQHRRVVAQVEAGVIGREGRG